MFSKKATKIDEIFTVNLTLCSRRQIDGEDFINFCGLLRKHELYYEGNYYLVFYVPFAKGASRWRLPFSTTRCRGMSHIRALIDRCTNHGSYRTAHGYDLKVMS